MTNGILTHQKKYLLLQCKFVVTRDIVFPYAPDHLDFCKLNKPMERHMLKHIKDIFGMIILAGAFTACEHHPKDIIRPGNPSGGGNTGGGQVSTTCDPDTVYFVNEILPVFKSNCAQSGCHDAVSAKEGYILDSYAHIIKEGIRPGRPDNSKIYKELLNGMPPNGPLPPDVREKIRKWILQGAQNNACNGACDTSKFKYSTEISNIINTNCATCHSSGNIVFNTYQGLKTVADDGRLWGAINHNFGYKSMPSETMFLSTCDITRIRKWIANGAPND
jgi:hypothetical protein